MVSIGSWGLSPNPQHRPPTGMAQRPRVDKPSVGVIQYSKEIHNNNTMYPDAVKMTIKPEAYQAITAAARRLRWINPDSLSNRGLSAYLVALYSKNNNPTHWKDTRPEWLLDLQFQVAEAYNHPYIKQMWSMTNPGIEPRRIPFYLPRYYVNHHLVAITAQLADHFEMDPPIHKGPATLYPYVAVAVEAYGMGYLTPVEEPICMNPPRKRYTPIAERDWLEGPLPNPTGPYTYRNPKLDPNKNVT